MKIFYAVQAVNNDGVRWRLEQDACCNIMRGLVTEVLKLRPQWEFHVKVPGYYPRWDDRVHIIVDHTVPVSTFAGRVHFDSRIFVPQDIDVAIIDESTLVKNWSTYFYDRKMSPKIVSTNYFFDCPAHNKVPPRIRYFDRQVESMRCADLVAFQCEASKRQMIDAMKEEYYPSVVGSTFVDKSTFWRCGVSLAEIGVGKPGHQRYPMVLFPNRITETADRYTNWHIFAAAARYFPKHVTPVMLNPSRKVTKEQEDEIQQRSQGRVQIVTNDSKFSRHDYLGFLRLTSVSVHLFESEAHGGLSCAEAMAAGCVCVFPMVNNYFDRMCRVNAEHYPYFCIAKSPENVADKVRYALKADQSVRDTMRRAAETEAYETIALDVVRDLEALLCTRP